MQLYINFFKYKLFLFVVLDNVVVLFDSIYFYILTLRSLINLLFLKQFLSFEYLNYYNTIVKYY